MKPWAIYFGIVAVSCFFYPPVIGFCMAVAVFCFLWWVAFKVIGG